MIASLRGTVDEIGENYVVLDVGGVGYQVFLNTRDLANLPSGKEVKLYTYLSVTENAMTLYGFLSKDDCQVFRQVITVSGIGPKGGLGIFSVMTASDLRFAVFSDDAKAISKAPGIGSKTAQKLILELKDKLKLEDSLPDAGNGTETGGGGGDLADKDARKALIRDAVEALVALGYSNAESLKAVRSVKIDDDMTVQAVISQAFKVIGL